MKPFDRFQDLQDNLPRLPGPQFSPTTEKTTYSELPDSDYEEVFSDSSNHLGFQQRRSSIRFRVTVTAFFLLLNVTFFAVVWLYTARYRHYDISDSLFPRRQYETRVFHVGHIAPGIETDQAWEEDLPHGHGFTLLNNAGDYNLPPGMAYADGHAQYGVSWAHQYHCLWMLRVAFFDLVNNQSKLLGVDIHEKSTEGAELWHLAHCFDYLRQHVMCKMDMTLEYPTLDGPNAGFINGYEVPHQCVRREPLDDYMDAHSPDPNLMLKVKPPQTPSHEELMQGLVKDSSTRSGEETSDQQVH